MVQFSIRTLLRSRQHRVILSFYLGMAFGLVIFFAKAPELAGTNLAATGGISESARCWWRAS